MSDNATLQKELALTMHLLELSEQLRIRLQLEVDQLRAASPRYTGMHPAMAAPYGVRNA